jgi:hypothetical protein
MDMKRILQAMDGISTKPVEGADDMKKFVSIIQEGANPHKVALPVQMAMQHYATPVVKAEKKQSLLKKYFQETEEVEAQALAEKRERLRMYSQTIAERVLMKESRVDEKSVSQAQAHFMAAAAHNPKFAKKVDMDVAVAKEFNQADKGRNIKKLPKHVDESPIEMTSDANDPTIYGHEKANPMSLKGRIQQARNQLKELANMAESDDLVVWEKITQLSKGGMFMGLEQNLEQIRHGIAELAAQRKKGGVASRGIDKNIGENEDPCWDNYKQIGTKKKGGKTVPNCVPKE